MKLDSNVRRKFSGSNFCSMPLFRNKKRPRFCFSSRMFYFANHRTKVFFVCLSFWPSLRSLNVNCDWNSRQIALHFFTTFYIYVHTLVDVVFLLVSLCLSLFYCASFYFHFSKKSATRSCCVGFARCWLASNIKASQLLFTMSLASSTKQRAE